MRPLLVLRPQPGADRTLARARAGGFDAIAAPLFTLAPVAWDAPDPGGYDALLLTSGNAARLAGPALDRYRHLPLYAVGAATARAAQAAGFASVHAGADDAAALVPRMHIDGASRVLHLAGREHHAIADAAVAIDRRIVYAADAVAALPEEAAAALARGAVALLHSPRAGATFAALLAAAGIDPAAVRVAAISAAAGAGRWRALALAAMPTDAALLAAAAPLCGAGLSAAG